MKRILVFSDLHGRIDLYRKLISSVQHDMVIFAGDWCVNETEEIKNIDYFIPGNNDYKLTKYHQELAFEIEGVHFFLTHGHLHPSFMSSVDNDKLVKASLEHGAQVIIHGHTHVKKTKVYKDILILNPGSLSEPRDGSKGSYAILEIEDGKILRAKIFDFAS